MSGNKGHKVNFCRACRKFSIINGQLIYKEKRIVISSRERQHIIIHDVHEGWSAVENRRIRALRSGFTFITL